MPGESQRVTRMRKTLEAKESLRFNVDTKTGTKTVPKNNDKPIEKGPMVIAVEANKECGILYDAGRFDEAFKYGQIALKNFTMATCLSAEGEIIYNRSVYPDIAKIYINLALIKIQDSKYEQAIEYLDEAHTYDPWHQGVIYRLWLYNLKTQNYEKSIAAAQIFDSPMNVMLMIKPQLYAEKISVAEARLLSKEVVGKDTNLQEKVWFLNGMAFIETLDNNYDAALSLYKAHQDLTSPEDIEGFAALVHNIVGVYCFAGRYAEGRSYFEAMQAAHPKLISHFNTLSTKYYKFLLYECTGDKYKATSLLKEINKEVKPGSTFKHISDHANQIRFFNEIEGNNFEAAKAYLRKTSLNKKLYSKKIDILKKALSSNWSKHSVVSDKELPYDEDLAIAIMESKATITDSEEQAAKPVINTSSQVKTKDEKPQNIEALPIIEAYEDPRSIHAFFQYRKKLSLSESFDKSYGKVKIAPSWILGKEKIISKESYNGSEGYKIYKVYNTDNYYVYIKNDFCQSEHEDAYEVAITQKGIVRRDVGQNGIKYCHGNGLAEVKISANARIWSDLTLLNADGKYLIVINRKGTHPAFNKAAEKGKMKVCGVDPVLSLKKEVKKSFKAEFKDDGYYEDNDQENPGNDEVSIKFAGEKSFIDYENPD